MKITKDIITDLLPVYFSGEASADTKKLLEDYLKENPEFATLIAEQNTFLPESQIYLTEENEMKTLNETKKLLQKRANYLGLTIFFLLLPASFRAGEKGFRWLWADMPIAIVIFLLLSIFFGFQYWLTNRKLRDSDL
jgi:hypothetical protein